VTEREADEAPKEGVAAGLWGESGSRFILLLSGIAAWVIAVVLAAVETSIPVATTFVPVGLALIGGAAFFDRLRKLGPGGLVVDPSRAIRQFSESLPPPPPDAPAGAERELLLDGLENYFEEVSRTADETLPAKLAGRRYEAGMALELAVRRWLEGEGHEVRAGSSAGVDLIGRRDDQVNVVEVMSSRSGSGGPTPEQLRNNFLQARIWADEELGDQGPLYRLLATDVVPPPHLLDRFRGNGIGIVHVDPDTEDVNLILSPKDSRS
jgi:hypothetical protein